MAEASQPLPQSQAVHKAAAPAKSEEPLYVVQLGSFKNEEGARKLKAGAAFVFVDRDVMIKTAQLEKTPVYNVCVGGFKNEEEARLFIEKNSISGARIALEE